MLDFNISLEFNPDINVISKGKVDALVITSCAIHMFPNDNRMYSDFDDFDSSFDAFDSDFQF